MNLRPLARPLAGLALFVAVACSQIGEPPGGPPDALAPKVISTFPESTMIVRDLKRPAEFRFDEVVNEGGSPNFGLGSGDLEKLIVLSPTENVPNVAWKRRRILVTPKEGWKPNRVYRIEFLPGIRDLRNNTAKTGKIITFTTGAPLPTRYLLGRVVDWGTSRLSPLALVEAMLLPDSLRYRTTADSSGAFSFGPLPEGEYVVAGALDQNHNNKLDPREVFDTIRVKPGRDTVGEIWAFKHDTLPARFQALARNDSVSVIATFNAQLDPYQTISADSVRVRLLPDSIDVKVLAIVTKERYDSIYNKPPEKKDTAKVDSVAIKARADSLARADSVARADSIRRAAVAARRAKRDAAKVTPQRRDEGPLKTKPALFDKVVIRLDTTLKPGAKYAVEMKGVRSVSGVPGRMILGFQVPEDKPPPDTTKAHADSVKAAEKAKADSLKAGTKGKGKKPDPKKADPKKDTPAPPAPKAATKVEADTTKAKADTTRRIHR